MKKGLVILIVIGLIVGIFAFNLFTSFNTIKKLEIKTDTQWSQVEIQLQRRFDLIPNLVETVKGFASHEKEAIEAVANARAKIGSGGTTEERIGAENELSGALSRLLVVVENYPNLKADANFRQLADELAGTENRISIARKDYNASIEEYRTVTETFPGIMTARIFGFPSKTAFEAADGTDEAPEVKF